MAIDKVDAKEREKIEAVRKLLRKQAPLSAKQVMPENQALLSIHTPLSSLVVSLTLFVRLWRRAGTVLQRRVRGAVPAVAGGEREEGREAPEDRPLMEGDRWSWYARAQLPFIPLAPIRRESSRLGPSSFSFSFGNLRWLPGWDGHESYPLMLLCAAMLCSSRRGLACSRSRYLRHSVFLVKLLCRRAEFIALPLPIWFIPRSIFKVQAATVRSFGAIMSE